MSRRRRPLLQSTAVIALIALVLVGCTPPNLPAPLPPDTTATVSTPAPPVVGGLISVGVDADFRGFNPYVAAQYSPAGDAISALVLPSVFAPGATAEGDQPTALVDKVAVTSRNPFTVTYSLNRGAAWSDGTPIAAEDFSYLWTQLRDNPGVVGAGGYQLISSVQSLDAGKTVVVQFSTPYADWRTLFSPLLPARTLKDQPGGFAAALQGGIPVAGSLYRVDSFDPVIGQTTLVRNDKYWGTETTGNTVVFRAGAPADLIESLRRGDLQAVYLQPDGEDAATLAGLGSTVQTQDAPLPTVANLTFNTAAERVAADEPVRRAVAAALDTASIRSALTGDNPAGALAPVSQLFLSADPAATDVSAPADITDDADRVDPILTDAGFTRSGLYYRRNGQVLSLILGYPLGNERSLLAAREIQRQLGAAGIQLNLVAQSDADFAVPLTAASIPDLVIVATPPGPSGRGAAVTALNCATALVPGTTTGTSTGATTTADPADELCTTTVADQVSEFLAGSTDGAELDAQLWQRLAVLPLAEPVAVLAIGPGMTSAPTPTDPAGLLWSGALSGLPNWESAP